MAPSSSVHDVNSMQRWRHYDQQKRQHEAQARTLDGRLLHETSTPTTRLGVGAKSSPSDQRAGISTLKSLTTSSALSFKDVHVHVPSPGMQVLVPSKAAIKGKPADTDSEKAREKPAEVQVAKCATS
jgi:hypothetical protein